MTEIKIYYVNGNGHDCVETVYIDEFPDYLTIDGKSVWPEKTKKRDKQLEELEEVERILGVPLD
jgi:hypothetical protein